MSAIEGQAVIVQTTPRTIAMAVQGRTGIIVKSCILADSAGDPALVASVLIGAAGSPQVVRTLWEGEFYVRAAPIAPVASQAATTPVTPAPATP